MDVDEKADEILAKLAEVLDEVRSLTGLIKSMDVGVARIESALGRLEGLPDGRSDAGLARYLGEVEAGGRVH